MNNKNIIQKIKEGLILAGAVFISLIIYLIEKIKGQNK